VRFNALSFFNVVDLCFECRDLIAQPLIFFFRRIAPQVSIADGRKQLRLPTVASVDIVSVLKIRET
jgi:hypothetical protein